MNFIKKFSFNTKKNKLINLINKKLILPNKYEKTKKEVIKCIRKVYEHVDITEEFDSFTNLENIVENIFSSQEKQISIRAFLKNYVSIFLFLYFYFFLFFILIVLERFAWFC